MYFQTYKPRILTALCVGASILTSACVAPPPPNGTGFEAASFAPAPRRATPIQAYQYSGAWCRLDNGQIYRISGGEPTITIFPGNGRPVVYEQIGDGTFQDAGGPGTYRFSGDSVTWRANNGTGQVVSFSRC